MNDLKHDAEVHRLGLLAGFYSVADVTAWADRLIEAEEAPDPALVEVSLSGQHAPLTVARELEAVPGERDETAAAAALLDRMRAALDAGEVGADEIPPMLGSLMCYNRRIFGDEGLVELHDRLDGATCPTPAEVQRQVDAFLSRRSDRLRS